LSTQQFHGEFWGLKRIFFAIFREDVKPSGFTGSSDIGLLRNRYLNQFLRGKDYPAISDTDSAGCGSAQADTQDHHVAAQNAELGLAGSGYRAPEKRDPHTVAQCPGCNRHPVDPGSADSGTVDLAAADNKVAVVAVSEW
jgi:hypothetical protein